MIRFFGSILIFSMFFSYSAPALASSTSEPDPEIGGTESDSNELEDLTGIQPDSWVNCHKLGKQDGRDISTSGSMFAGIACGVVLGLVGTGLAILLQGESSPSALFLENIEEDQCQYAYLEAFQDQSQSQKRYAALRGGLVGTVLAVMIFVALDGLTDGFK